MSSIASLFETIADNLDKRRLEFTKVRRILMNYVSTPLESAAVRMSIPMIYALWEGYVREVCQLYLEHIETHVSRAADLQPAILGYMWTPALRPLTGGLNFSRKTSIAELVLTSASTPVSFRSTEKEIGTKSNLKHSVLEDIAAHLCLDISPLAGWKSHLNALVDLRNNIAHGSRPTGLSYLDFDTYAHDTLMLMEGFEEVLLAAVRSSSYERHL